MTWGGDPRGAAQAAAPLRSRGNPCGRGGRSDRRPAPAGAGWLRLRDLLQTSCSRVVLQRTATNVRSQLSRSSISENARKDIRGRAEMCSRRHTEMPAGTPIDVAQARVTSRSISLPRRRPAAPPPRLPSRARRRADAAPARARRAVNQPSARRARARRRRRDARTAAPSTGRS